jgi:DNA-binding NarL/FixJ family response regulator
MGAIAPPPCQDSAAKILIVDDHPAAREGLALGITRQSGLRVCGEADDTTSALRQIAAEVPDLVVLDVSLRGGSGMDLIKRIRDRHPTVRVLVWSMFDEALYAGRVLRAGASGYIEKTQPTERIVAAIVHVLAGSIHLSPAMTEVLLRQAKTGQTAGSDPVATLSDRELEVFRLFGLGLDTQQIAERLHLSPKTVETYRGRIKQKLGAESGSAVIRLAVRWVVEQGNASGA